MTFQDVLLKGLYPGAGGGNLTLANSPLEMKLIHIYCLWLLGVSETSLFTFPGNASPQAALGLARHSAGGTVTSSLERSLRMALSCQSASGECIPCLACMISFSSAPSSLASPKSVIFTCCGRLHQHVPGCQVPMHQAPVFQVIHALKHRATWERWAS